MKTLQRTTTVHAHEIIAFGKKGGAIVDTKVKGENLVMRVDPKLEPKVGDFLVRDVDAHERGAWTLMRKAEMVDFKPVKVAASKK